MATHPSIRKSILWGILLGLAIVGAGLYRQPLQGYLDTAIAVWYRHNDQDTGPASHPVPSPVPLQARGLETAATASAAADRNLAHAVPAPHRGSAEAFDDTVAPGNPAGPEGLGGADRRQPAPEPLAVFFMRFDRRPVAERYAQMWRDGTGVAFQIVAEDGFHDVYHLAADEAGQEENLRAIFERFGIRPGRKGY